jgi:thiol peroxidase
MPPFYVTMLIAEGLIVHITPRHAHGRCVRSLPQIGRQRARSGRDTVMERVGEAFELDERLTILGRQLRAGDLAPDFALESFDPETEAMRVVRLGDTSGRVRLLNVVNSVDTPVCHIETRRWDGLRADLPDEVVLFTISMDLPFAQARWRSTERVGHDLLSAHKDEGFGQAYGVLVKEWRLLQRAVFVIDREDRIVYADYVADQMAQPDYNAALAAAQAAVDGP